MAKTSVTVFSVPLATSELAGSGSLASAGDLDAAVFSSLDIQAPEVSSFVEGLSISTEAGHAELLIGNFLSSSLGSLAVDTEQDVAPTIISTPEPVFSDGVPAIYEMSQNVSDDGLSPVTYTLTPSVTGSLSFNPSTGSLSYNGGQDPGATNRTLTVTDAVGSDVSPSFDILVEQPSSVVFETDFSQDAGFDRSNVGFVDFGGQKPRGFDAIRTNNHRIACIAGAGIGGSVACRFFYESGGGQVLANSLMKHLTNNQNTGIDDIYIRYRFKLPENWRAGAPGEPMSFWKWGRLWQNNPPAGGGWTEQRTDSLYIVWNWGPGQPNFGIRNNFTFAQNLNQTSTGSTGSSPRHSTDWYSNGAGRNTNNTDGHIGVDGNWDNIGAGGVRFVHSTRELVDSPQTWHTVEWRFRYSSTATSNDGFFQVWFDGVEQIHPNIMNVSQTIDQPSTTNTMNTAALPGANAFTLFDNMAGWSQDWEDAGVDGYIDLNDVVISTDRIGASYEPAFINNTGSGGS